jgi:cytochrome c oxidase cbb3-type subunit I/II
MWRAFDETGRLAYPDFVETVIRLMPMYWVRVVGGTLYLVGMLIFGINMAHDVGGAPATYEVPVSQARRCRQGYDDPPRPTPAPAWALASSCTLAPRVGARAAEVHGADVHRGGGGLAVRDHPDVPDQSNVPTIASVKPYTPLELAGRDIYIARAATTATRR